MKASQRRAIIEAWAWRPGDPVAPDVDDTHPQAGPKYSCKRDLPESAYQRLCRFARRIRCLELEYALKISYRKPARLPPALELMRTGFNAPELFREF